MTTGEQVDRLPASCSWSVIRSSRFIGSAAPMSGCTATSTRDCRRLAQRVTLRTSFRSRPNIQRAINAAFEPVMAGGRRRAAADYVPLEPFSPESRQQPSVVVLPVPEPYGSRRVSNAAIEKSLPDAAGAYIDWLINQSGWKVAERPATREIVSGANCGAGFSARRRGASRADSGTPYLPAVSPLRQLWRGHDAPLRGCARSAWHCRTCWSAAGHFTIELRSKTLARGAGCHRVA